MFQQCRRIQSGSGLKQVGLTQRGLSLESASYQRRVLPRKIRWLAILTGRMTGVALLSFLWLSLSGLILIVGAVVQTRLPRTGRWVLYLAAPMVSVWVVPFGAVNWWETLQGLNRPPLDVFGLSLSFAWLISPILLLWCNAALVLEAVKERRTRAESIRVDIERIS